MSRVARFAGYAVFSALICTLVAWAAGGFSFVRRPLGIAVLVIWFSWWLGTALYRPVGRASKYSRRALGLTLVLIPVYLVALVAAPWEYGHYAGPLPRNGLLAWVGIALFAAGALLSVLAMRALHGSFTLRLDVATEQALVTTGPYALVRNPGYLGYITALLGLGLALSSLVGITLAVGAAIAFAARIQREERMLLAEFGEPYRSYIQRTRRLFPFIY